MIFSCYMKNPALCRKKVSAIRSSYPGRIATAGNLAFPFSPSEFRGGEVFNMELINV